MSKYIDAQPVVIVEPRHDASHAVTTLIAGVAVSFLLALVAWWLGPIIFGDSYALGYWQTFALIYFLRMIIPRASSPKYQSNRTANLP